MFYADDRVTGIETNNTAVGSEALRGSTTPSNNTGTSNTAVGDRAMIVNTSGSSNTAIGKSALAANQTGSGNVAIGTSAMTLATGSENTVVGANALDATTTGTGNVALGKNALNFNTTGSYNMALGYDADVLNVGVTNATAIGKNAKVATGNSLVLGGTGSDAVYVGIGSAAPTAHLDVTATVNEAKFHLINKGSGSAGIEIRTTGPQSQYIDFTHSSTLELNSGTPDFTNRIISNTTSFSIPGISIANSTNNVTMPGTLGIGGSASSGALLEITSTTKAFILPRMTKAQRNAMPGQVDGMMIYQTDAVPGLRVRTNGNWVRYTETLDN
jgi:hypothetical protein